MKRVIGIMIVTLILFIGCNQIGSIINPIIGTWEATVATVYVNATFNADGTFTETNSWGVFGDTRSGTWDSDSEIITLTSDGDVDNYSYYFNSDKSEMTLEPDGGITSITYSRQ
jgi:hypothetical protein